MRVASCLPEAGAPADSNLVTVIGRVRRRCHAARFCQAPPVRLGVDRLANCERAKAIPVHGEAAEVLDSRTLYVNINQSDYGCVAGEPPPLVVETP